MHDGLVLPSHLSWLENVSRWLENWCSIVHVGHELEVWRVDGLELTLLPLRLHWGGKEFIDDRLLHLLLLGARGFSEKCTVVFSLATRLEGTVGIKCGSLPLG